jgi:biopolymer transport protein TolR
MRTYRHRRRELFEGINITPFTDVVLVLLIIFMIATPLLIRSEIKVNLPRTSNAEAAPQKTLVITIDAAGSVYVEGARTALANLRPGLVAALAKRPGSPVIIMGDRDVRYDLVIRVLEIARSAGVSRLSLAVEVRK